jgi:hypothetical protein
MRYGTTVAKSSPGARAVTRIGLAVWIVCFGFAQSASAEVSISGQANALKLETRGATLDEVLRALQAAFKFHYQDTGTLNNVISGTYAGSLRGVVSRLLGGHDFVMQGSLSDLSVAIVAPKNAASAGRAVSVKAAPAAAPERLRPGTDPVKECQYKDGDKVIPVEC